MTNDWAGTRPVLDAVKEFERTHPGVRVDIQGPIIENVSAAVRAQIAQGNPPDVVQWHAFAAGAQGFAEELDDLWKDRLEADEFLAGAVEDVEWAGHMYGVPLDTNAMLLIYNVPRFRAADIDPRRVRTFADLERQAAAVTSRDGTQRAIAFPSSTWATYGWFRANGGEIVEVGSDGKPRFTFDRKENVEALAYLARNHP
jgi:multiple sugar transport system substrate-binding protein